jgi:hypothetical protein
MKWFISERINTAVTQVKSTEIFLGETGKKKSLRYDLVKLE